MNTLLSALIGGAAGILKFLFATYMENQRRKDDAMLAAANIQIKDRERAANVKDNGVSFTRRVLALILTLTLCAPVWYSLIHPDSTITIPQTVLDRGFWDWVLPWKDAKEITEYVSVPSPIIAMPIYDLAAMAVGFYFASGGSRGR